MEPNCGHASCMLIGLLDVFSMLIREQGRNIRMHIEKNTKDKIARNPLGLTCVENNVLFHRNMMLPTI